MHSRCYTVRVGFWERLVTGFGGKAVAIPLAIADGNPLVLSAMAEIFGRDSRFSLVSTTSSAEGFLGLVLRVPVAVAVIDWTVPQMGGQKLLEVLRDRPGAPRIVVYGEGAGGNLARAAMAAGAAGFSARTAPVERLLETCASVAAGQMVFPFLDVRELAQDPIALLTGRERALLEALSRGSTNNTLAGEFGISANTVKFHLSNLYEKLEVTSRAQAIAFYYSSRLPAEARRH